MTKVKIRTSQQAENQMLFNEWNENRNWIILDTETTGLGWDAEIVEISIIDSTGKVLYDSLVKPQRSIPDDAIAIHGISNEDVACAPTWSEVWQQIQPIFANYHKILIFNAEYDERLIRQSCKIAKIDGIDDELYEFYCRCSCVMEAYAQLLGSDRWISLANATGKTTLHRALADCQAVLQLINKHHDPAWTETNYYRIVVRENLEKSKQDLVWNQEEINRLKVEQEEHQKEIEKYTAILNNEKQLQSYIEEQKRPVPINIDDDELPF